VRCALEISQPVKSHLEIHLRMGIHSGPISEVTDVNERANIAGAGIDTAQRVMDCGDAGHILLSKRVADDLAPYPRWNRYLRLHPRVGARPLRDTIEKHLRGAFIVEAHGWRLWAAANSRARRDVSIHVARRRRFPDRRNSAFHNRAYTECFADSAHIIFGAAIRHHRCA
jgi:hypothetical protein